MTNENILGGRFQAGPSADGAGRWAVTELPQACRGCRDVARLETCGMMLRAENEMRRAWHTYRKAWRDFVVTAFLFNIRDADWICQTKKKGRQ